MRNYCTVSGIKYLQFDENDSNSENAVFTKIFNHPDESFPSAY